MSNEQALLTCTFGWGKTCSLYYDSLKIAGKSYNLKDLTSIHPSYRIVLGVPSARLELSFGAEHLVLRGIADLDIARLMVAHLQPYCPTPVPGAHLRPHSSRARNLARAQARAWERTNISDTSFDPAEEVELTPRTSDLLKHTDALSDIPGSPEEVSADNVILLDAVPIAPIADTSLTPGETLEAFARLSSNMSTYASPLPTSIWQPPHTPRFQPPLHSVHLIPPHQKFDSSSMPVPVVKSSVLPIIHVPVRLLHGECAHYSIGATLCSDRIASSARATYPPLDQGLLILTNRRVLYMGKRCQFTLAYTHLWYVSLLNTAIALHIEGQFRRIIIELEHPHEWASRIELLSFIARRERPEPPTRTVAAIPGLNMTVKRPAIKPPAAKPAPVDVATVPLLSERAVSKIAEARTVEIEDATIQACAERETLDFPAAPTKEPLELVRSNTPRSVNQSTKVAASAHEDEQEMPLEQRPTQDFPAQPDVAEMTTREFDAPEPAPELADAPTQTISRLSESTRRSQQPPEPSTEDLSEEEDDDRTIHLNERKLCQLRTVSMRTTVADKPPDSQTTGKRVSRVRVGARR